MNYIKRFFKFIIKSIIFSIVLIFVAAFIISLMFGNTVGGFSDPPVEVKKNTVLEIDFSKPYRDIEAVEPFNLQEFVATQKITSQITFFDLIRQIKRAKKDPNIRGLKLYFSGFMGSYAEAEEIISELENFKESEKFIWAYANDIDQKSLYISSVADIMVMNPIGYANVNGLMYSRMYLKGMLDKIGASFFIFRNGKYKSAIEPFYRTSMSLEEREQGGALITDIWSRVNQKFAKKSGLTLKEINDQINQMEYFQTKDLVDSKLVDFLGYRSDFDDAFKNKEIDEENTELSTEFEKIKLEEGERFNLLSLSAYSASGNLEEYLPSSENVAVIILSGTLTDTQGSSEVIASKKTVKMLKKIAANPRIKSVVVRVNSPGGGMVTSDIIWREIKKLNKKIPVVISMGTYAASGGYYISAPGTKIVANNSTITGSIGIFGLFPYLRKTAEKVGITSDRVKTHDHSEIGNVFHYLKKDEYNRIQGILDDGYRTFLSKVSEGRNMEVQKVDSIGQGRVWTGAQAKSVGLVDEIGGYSRAIEIAANLSNLEEGNYGIKVFPEPKTLFESLMDIENKEVSISVFILKKFPFIDQTLIDVFSEIEEEKIHEERQIRFYYRHPYNINIQ